MTQERLWRLIGVYARQTGPEAKLTCWALKQLQQAHVALRVLELGAQNASTVDAPWVEEIATRGLADLEEKKSC